MTNIINISNEIDILTGAPVQFIKEVELLESITDVKERSNEALRYLKNNNCILSIGYETLIIYLANYMSCPTQRWRQLYLLERSIPPRANSQQKSWLDRLKIFADTYKLEKAVNRKLLNGLPGKILFSKESGDHENLHAGIGSYFPDFYCWDALNSKLHAFVELKCWSSTNIQNAKDYYKNKRYNARYVLVFMSDHQYKLIDYQEDKIIDQPDLQAPKLLIL